MLSFGGCLKEPKPIDGKCPNFSLRLCLRTRGELMLANFGLKIRPFWDSDHENWYSTFLENERLFARTTYIRLLIYLKAIYGQKNEGNRFFNYCYSMVDISWLLLLIFAIFRRSWSRNTSETTRRDVAVCKTRCRETTFSCFSLTLRWTLPCVVPVRRLLMQSRSMHFGGELARTTSPETH